MKAIKIDKHLIDESHPPFIIAEMSGNHNQSLEHALAIVDAAAEAGAHAIKLQTYTADTITFNSYGNDFMIDENNPLWKGSNLYDLYKKGYTPWEWHEKIFLHAHKKGLIAFSSPFDETAVDFLETLNVPCYKIASFENNHIPLLKKVAKTGKPVIMSTGVATITDIYEAVTTLKQYGCNEIVLLKCTSTYPANPKDSNIRTIAHLRELFQCLVGLSDHTMGIGVAVASVAFGASVIEKHLTISRKEGGVDAAFSLEPHELKMLVEETQRAFSALGKITYEMNSAEQKNTKYKRSIYVVKNIKVGEVISEDAIQVIRPAGGLHPRYFELVMGKQVRKDIQAGTPLSWEYII